MTKIQKIKIILLACVLSLVAAPVFAAEIFFEVKTNEVQIEEKFEVKLLMNAEQESINAVEGKIIFSGDILDLKEIRYGSSIVNFWIERPSIPSIKADINANRPNKREIIFSGITPGGYSGKQGLIFSLVFEAKNEGGGIIEIKDAKALKNDGLGTPAEIKISDFPFNIKDVGRPYIDDDILSEMEDKESPESFVPEIVKDEAIFGGKWFVVFATQDKISDIDRYEVKETKNKRLGIRRWQIAESPYVLADQELRSFVWIKAIDKAGNERIIKIAPRHPLAWYENYENWVIIIILIIVVTALFWIWKKNKKLKPRY